MARKALFTDVFETDTFNQWRLKTNSIKLNLQDMFDEIDNFDQIAVLLTKNQTIDGVKSFVQKSNWTKEYTQNQVTPLLELKVTNSMVEGSNIGHQGTGPAIDFYNPDTSASDGSNTYLVSRIASITEINTDKFPNASLVFFTGKNVESPTEKMRITSSGQVGIGTSLPKSGVQLNVQTADNNSVIAIQSKGDRFAAITFGDEKSHKSGQILYHNLGNSMRFFTGEDTAVQTSSAERLRITNTGAVGIGTTNPSVKLDIVGDLKTSGFIHAGEASGGVALTLNDGYGNANVAFNHASGRPTRNGSSARIETSVDETTGRMIFEVGDNSIKDSTRNLTQVVQLKTNLVDIFTPTNINGKTNITGRLGVLDVENPDFALCIGARSDEPGHVAINADGGAISLRPTKNTTHAWLINAFDSPGGDLAITSRKRNTTTNKYVDTHALRFQSNASISIPNNLTIGKTTKSNQILIRDTWNANGPAGGQALFIKDLDKHSSYDPHGTGDGNNNYTISKGAVPLIISDNNSSTSGPNSHGIVLYNASGTPGSFAPSILFASREAGTTNFRSATAGIYSRSPLNIGGAPGATGEINNNYNDGELIFATSGTLSDGTTNSQGVTQRMVIDRTGKVGIGTSEPKETLDVVGNVRIDGPYIFVQNDGYPQLVLSNADGKTKRFGIWKSGSAIDRMTLGPQNANGSGLGAIFINRNATVDLPRGGTVNVVTPADNSLVNRIFVENLVNQSDAFNTLKTLSLKANDNNLEGGQITLNRSSDDTAYWNIDAHGSTSTPSLRFFHENDEGAATVSMYITSSDKVGIREADPDWDLCIGGKSTDAGSVAITAGGGAISLRPTKNTTHAWMFNAFDAPGANSAIVSREYVVSTGRYKDTNILTFNKNGQVTSTGDFVSSRTIKSLGAITSNGTLSALGNMIFGSTNREGAWILESRQGRGSRGDYFELASRNDRLTDWNFGSGFRQYKSGSVNIGGTGEKSGYQLYVDGNILLKKDADIIQEGKTTPNNWGGGLTTFDVYSDGGTLGVGKDGSLECYLNRDGNGFVKNSLELGYTPTKNSHAVRKDYVDAKVAGITSTTSTFTGRTAFFSGDGPNSTIATRTSAQRASNRSHAGNNIPTASDTFSHGHSFVSKFTTNHGHDGGGILIDVSDSNGDEHAISVYNVNTHINKEVFHVRAATGDTYSAGDFFNRGNIGTEGNISIGQQVADYYSIQRGANNTNLSFVHNSATGNKILLSFSESSGNVNLTRDGTTDKSLVTKKYVDDRKFLPIQSKSDITTRLDSGFYETITGTKAEGWPEDTRSWQHLITSTHSNTANYYALQIAAPFFDQEIYFRNTHNDGKKAWQKFWHTGNDGANSGLDADKLDGNHAAVFAKINTKVSVSTPTADNHAATKKYVDDSISISTSSSRDLFGRSDFPASGARDVTRSHVGSVIPSGTGKHSHGLGFVAKFTTTSGSDGGGISIDVTDSNFDELAISAYNKNPGLNREIFHVRATNGDVYSSGDIYNLGNIGTEGRIQIGKTGDFHYISKHATDGLTIGYTKSTGSITGLRIKENGTVALGKTGTANGDLVNKKYVDDKVSSIENVQNENTGGSAPYYGCRAWAHYNGVTKQLLQNGNVKSVGYINVGHYRFIFDVAMKNKYYSANVSVSQEYISGKGHTVPFIFNQQTWGFDAVMYDEDNSAVKVDKSYVNITVFA